MTVRPADFQGAPQAVRAQINKLIAEQTAGKITDLLGLTRSARPPGSCSPTRSISRLAWAVPFPAYATADAPFVPAPSAAWRRLAADRPDDAAHDGPGLPAG